MRCVVNILMLMLIEDIKRLWLGGGYYGAPVVLEVTDTMQYRYVMRDHLGSITHVYTAEPIPTLLQELSYDAWGRLRNPDTHEAYASDSIPTPILGRGYTGHRHIAGIGLIDMNARLYDPMLGRFLSPDPHIQSPDCPQNYNRYTYCLNNPLKYVDILGLFASEAEAIEASKRYPGSRVGYARDKGEWYVSYRTSTKLMGVEYARVFSCYISSIPAWASALNTSAGGVSVANDVKIRLINYGAKNIPEFAEYINYTKALGRLCTYVNIGYAFFNLADGYENKTLTTGQGIKYTADIIVGLVSLTVPGGAIIGSLYFIGDVLTNGYGTND